MTIDYKQLSAAMDRAKAVSDRLSARIQSRILTPGPKPELDDLFAQAHRVHALYMRIYARYEAEKPQFLKDMWL